MKIGKKKKLVESYLRKEDLSSEFGKEKPGRETVWVTKTFKKMLVTTTPSLGPIVQDVGA